MSYRPVLRNPLGVCHICYSVKVLKFALSFELHNLATLHRTKRQILLCEDCWNEQTQIAQLAEAIGLSKGGKLKW